MYWSKISPSILIKNTSQLYELIQNKTKLVSHQFAAVNTFNTRLGQNSQITKGNAAYITTPLNNFTVHYEKGMWG